MGLGQLFGLGLGLLGLGSKTDPDNVRALKEFQQLREEREKHRLGKQETQQAAQGGPTNGCLACGTPCIERQIYHL